jgi:hypothetical protein
MSELAMNKVESAYEQDKIHGRIDALHRYASESFARQEIHSNGNDQTVLLLTTVGSLVVGGDVGACCLLFNGVRENKQSKRN